MRSVFKELAMYNFEKSMIVKFCQPPPVYIQGRRKVGKYWGEGAGRVDNPLYPQVPTALTYTACKVHDFIKLTII